ncbi:MAG: hypothetical protein IKU65_07020 [Oscillospiraceae bacterium]|nr:hypothetical protein [Oscillospiraceae bacterium]
MKAKRRGYVYFLIAAAAVLLLLWLLFLPESAEVEESVQSPATHLPFSELSIELSEEGELSFFAEMEKGELLNLFKKGDVELSTALNIGSFFLPKTIDVSGKMAVVSPEEGGIALRFLEITVNEHEITEKVIRGIGEMHLDFKRSLVYN